MIDILRDSLKQWPGHLRIPLVCWPSKMPFNEFLNLRNYEYIPHSFFLGRFILDCIDVVKQFKMAERNHVKDKLALVWEYSDQMENPKANIERCSCPACEGEGCSLCWGYELSRNYTGGRERC